MDLKTIFTKTAKGLTQINQRTQSLSRDLTKALKLVDGKSTLEQLAEKNGIAMPVLQKALNELKKDGFVKIFEVKNEEPLSDFGGDDDFDFTAPAKLPATSAAGKSAVPPMAGFGPSPYRSPAANEQVPRADLPKAVAPPPAAPAVSEVDEAVLIAARIKAQAEARARAEREAQVRARLEVEARARKDAELRALEEAKRAQQAAENARAELELRLSEEKKQREIAAETREQMTRDQLAQQAEQQKALSAARAKAEAEAQGLSRARAAAEAEAKALSEARLQADAAAKRQAVEFEAAQRDLRQQLKAEIEAQVRAEMEAMLKSDIEEGARDEVEAAVRQGAQEDARRMLEERLNEERSLIERAGADATQRAEIDAKSMLAAQEAKIRAEMEERITALNEEKNQAEIKARKMAEAQAEAAAQAAAEFSARLKIEEEARQKVQAKAEEQQLRLEQLARTESQERARVEAEMTAILAAEKAAKIQAEARALIEQELREKAQLASRAELEGERKAREEADRNAAAQRARLEAKAREEAEERARIEAEMIARLAAEKGATAEAEARARAEAELRKHSERESQSELENERRARSEAERKAQTEVAAREIASRAISGHAAERERFEREAEERLQQERALREKAEEKSRVEEVAEAAARAAQVARLRELQEQAERNQTVQADIASGKRRPSVRRERHLLRWTMLGIIGFLVLSVILIQVVPLGAVNTRLEKALASWVHDDVTSSGLRIGLFPRPHVKLDQIAFGKLLDAKASSGKIYMDMTALFGDRFIIESFELEDVSITAEALGRAARWGDPEGRPKSIEISKIILKNVKLDIKDINLDVFDAELKFNKSGAINSASLRNRGNKWSVDIAPNSASAVASAGTENTAPPAGDFTVDFNAREMIMPIGTPILFNNISAKGVLGNQQMVFTEVNAKLLDGSSTGSLKIDWKQGMSLTGNFSVKKIKLDQAAELFTRGVSLSGRLDGEYAIAALAGSVGNLLEQPKIQGNFSVREGSIGNVDLVQVLRSQDGSGQGGQSKFSELTGQLRAADGVIHYEKMKLVGGVLLANGNIHVVYATGALSGSVGAEIRSNVAQDRANFSISGNVARPALKRGG